MEQLRALLRKPKKREKGQKDGREEENGKKQSVEKCPDFPS